MTNSLNKDNLKEYLDRIEKTKCELIAEKIMGYKRVPEVEINEYILKRYFPIKEYASETKGKRKFWTKTDSGCLKNYTRKVPNYSYDIDENAKLLEKLRIDYSLCIYNIGIYWIVSIYSKDNKNYLASGWYTFLPGAVVNSVYNLLSKKPQTNTQHKDSSLTNYFKSLLLRIFQHFDKPEDKFNEFKKFFY